MVIYLKDQTESKIKTNLLHHTASQQFCPENYWAVPALLAELQLFHIGKNKFCQWLIVLLNKNTEPDAATVPTVHIPGLRYEIHGDTCRTGSRIGGCTLNLFTQLDSNKLCKSKNQSTDDVQCSSEMIRASSPFRSSIAWEIFHTFI